MALGVVGFLHSRLTELLQPTTIDIPPAPERMEDVHYNLEEDELRLSLERAAAGEKIDFIIMELYVNAEEIEWEPEWEDE